MTTSAVHRRRPRISTTSADATPCPSTRSGSRPSRPVVTAPARPVTGPCGHSPCPSSRPRGGRAGDYGRARRLQDGGAIAPHCPFLMQGPSPVLTVPGGQASRWLVVLFEVPLAPAPLLLPRSPLVLPPATPGEELRPVAPVPWPPP